MGTRQAEDFLRKKLDLEHRIAAQYIHDSDWTLDELREFSRMPIGAFMAELEKELYEDNECPICFRRFVYLGGAQHADNCLMKEWLDSYRGEGDKDGRSHH